MIKYFLPSEM